MGKEGNVKQFELEQQWAADERAKQDEVRKLGEILGGVREELADTQRTLKAAQQTAHDWNVKYSEMHFRYQELLKIVTDRAFSRSDWS